MYTVGDVRGRFRYFFDIVVFEFRSTKLQTFEIKNLRVCGDLLKLLNTYTLTSTKLLEGLEGKKTSVHKLLEPMYSFNILTLLALSV